MRRQTAERFFNCLKINSVLHVVQVGFLWVFKFKICAQAPAIRRMKIDNKLFSNPKCTRITFFKNPYRKSNRLHDLHKRQFEKTSIFLSFYQISKENKICENFKQSKFFRREKSTRVIFFINLIQLQRQSDCFFVVDYK